jgi:hypothetical protein
VLAYLIRLKCKFRIEFELSDFIFVYFLKFF